MARINNRSIARMGLSFGAAALVALGTALPSFADTSVTVGGVAQSGGAITFGNFGVTLNGSAQTPTSTFSFADIIDPRGTGVGWNLSLTLAQFTDGASDTLLLNSLKVRNTPIVSKLDPTSSATSTITSTLVPGAPLDTGSGIKLLSAAASGGGMGSYNVSPVDLSLAVPANTPAGTYTSTATVSLNAVP